MEKGVKDESAQIQVDISHLTLGQISEVSCCRWKLLTFFKQYFKRHFYSLQNFVKEIGNRGAQQQGKEFLKEIVQSLVENAGRVESALKISSECSTSDSGNVTFQVSSIIIRPFYYYYYDKIEGLLCGKWQCSITKTNTTLNIIFYADFSNFSCFWKLNH